MLCFYEALNEPFLDLSMLIDHLEAAALHGQREQPRDAFSWNTCHFRKNKRSSISQGTGQLSPERRKRVSIWSTLSLWPYSLWLSLVSSLFFFCVCVRVLFPYTLEEIHIVIGLVLISELADLNED